MYHLNLVFQIATATLLGLVCILLAKHWRSGMNTWTGIGFALSILCYIIIESDVIQSTLVPRPDGSARRVALASGSGDF